MSVSGFMPIVAMFYALFHPTEGTKVRHQVPTGSIVPPSDRSYDTSALAEPLFDFDSIKSYVIPKPALSNRMLTVKAGSYRVLGFPIRVSGDHYNRNFFTFNMCFVFEYESDTTPYEPTIKRLGKMLKALEEQSQMFSKAEEDDVYFNLENPKQRISSTEVEDALGNNKDIVEDSRYLKVVQDNKELDNQLILEKNTPGQKKIALLKLSSIESLIQQIFQELNDYSECMIPIDTSNSVDIKLFPINPPPPDLNPADVPIAIVDFDDIVDSCWDPTMRNILPFVNGINTIQKISELSDTEFEFTKRCIQELMHYQSIDILDVFQFSNIYAPTSKVGTFISHPRISLDCQEYVISTTGTFNTMPPENKKMVSSNSELTNIDQLPGSVPSKPVVNSVGDEGVSASPDIANMNPVGDGVVSASPEIANMNSVGDGGVSASPDTANMDSTKETILTLPSVADLFKLYISMNQKITLRDWYFRNQELLKHIDIRKFVTFGVLRGIIYRVRSYPISSKLVNLNMGTSSYMYNRSKRSSAHYRRSRNSNNYNISTLPITNTDADKMNERGKKLVSEKAEEENPIDDFSQMQNERKKIIEKLELIKLVRNASDFDLICSRMHKTRTEVIAILNETKEDYHIVKS